MNPVFYRTYFHGEQGPVCSSVGDDGLAAHGWGGPCSPWLSLPYQQAWLAFSQTHNEKGLITENRTPSVWKPLDQ